MNYNLKFSEACWKQDGKIQRLLSESGFISETEHKFLEGRPSIVSNIIIIVLYNFPMLSKMHPINWTELSDWETSEWITYVFATRRYK